MEKEILLATWLHTEYIVHCWWFEEMEKNSPSLVVGGYCNPTKRALLLPLWHGMRLLCMHRAG
jgi:hypothetical protein